MLLSDNVESLFNKQTQHQQLHHRQCLRAQTLSPPPIVILLVSFYEFSFSALLHVRPRPAELNHCGLYSQTPNQQFQSIAGKKQKQNLTNKTLLQNLHQLPCLHNYFYVGGRVLPGPWLELNLEPTANSARHALLRMAPK